METQEERTEAQTEERMEERKRKQRRRHVFPAALLVVAILCVVLIATVVSRTLEGRSEPEPEVTLETMLKEIIETSDLSTYTAVYNGIAEVTDPENPEKIRYYVSYEASVDAGIDLEEVDVRMEEDEEGGKTILVTIPPVQIQEPTVDVGTLDYMFVDRSANTSGISAEALSACREDARQESQAEEKIRALAEENARNIMEAWILPFVEQLDSECSLEVRMEGEA